MSNPEFEHFENDDVPNHNTVLKPNSEPKGNDHEN